MTNVLGEKCDSVVIEAFDGSMYGEIVFSVPNYTGKWRIEIEFDRNVTLIDADTGTNEQCIPDENKCSFENEYWNAEKYADDEFDAGGFEAEYDDEDDSQPKIKKVIFQSCSSVDCIGWTTDAIVCEEEIE